jgi:hypothetical protein
MNSLKKTFLIIFFINLVVIGGVYLFLEQIRPKPVPVTLSGLGITSLFPSTEYQPASSQDWWGFRFPGNLRMLVRDYPDPHNHFDTLLEKAYPRYRLKKEIPLYERGMYVLRKKSKGYILAAVFIRGTRIYWFDLVSNSTLDFNLDLFHQLLVNLKINGEPVDSGLSEQLPAPGGEISIFTIQPPGIFLLMFSVILLFTLALVYVIFHIATRPPPRKMDGILRICTRDVTYTYRKGWQRNSSPACLCREGDTLVLYRFRKSILKIDLNQEGNLLKRKKKNLIYHNYFIRISDDDLRRLNLHHLLQYQT